MLENYTIIIIKSSKNCYLIKLIHFGLLQQCIFVSTKFYAYESRLVLVVQELLAESQFPRAQSSGIIIAGIKKMYSHFNRRYIRTIFKV
jgi:hypothetical protein